MYTVVRDGRRKGGLSPPHLPHLTVKGAVSCPGSAVAQRRYTMTYRDAFQNEKWRSMAMTPFGATGGGPSPTVPSAYVTIGSQIITQRLTSTCHNTMQFCAVLGRYIYIFCKQIICRNGLAVYVIDIINVRQSSHAKLFCRVSCNVCVGSSR